MTRNRKPVPAPKVRLSAIERRAQLLAVGRGVFAAHGYEATTLDEVAAQAGVSKPIIYEHFGAKEGLYAAIVDGELDALVARIGQAIGTGTPRARFEGAVVAFLGYAQDQPDGFAVLTRDAPSSTRSGLKRVIDDLVVRVDDIFQAEFRRAGFNAKVAPIYANALLGMVTQVGLWWAADGHGFSAAFVARHVAALGWMGLRHLPTEPAAAKAPARRRPR